MFFAYIGMIVVGLLALVGLATVLTFLVLGAWPESLLALKLRMLFGDGRTAIAVVKQRPEVQQQGRRA